MLRQVAQLLTVCRPYIILAHPPTAFAHSLIMAKQVIRTVLNAVVITVLT